MMSNYYNDSTNTNVIPIIRMGEVISITDPTKSGRIQVRITGIDDKESDKNLIPCVPLLPKYVTALPKVGESVFVFQYENSSSSPTSSFKTKRFWVGPLITQPTKLEGEFYNSSLSILPDGYTKLKDPNLEIGTYGEDEDIILQGRYNTDIIQKDRQIWLRVGKYVEGSPNKFNDKNLGYIQLKFGGEKLKREVVEKEVVNFIKEFPKTQINVTINTITNAGNILSGNLPKDSYRASDINRTEVFINVVDIETGNTLSGFEDESSFVGSQSRDEAIKKAKEYSDNIIENNPKWRIKSKAEDFIKTYGGSDGLAQFTSEPIEVKKKIKEIKLLKNDTEKTSVINVVADKINLLSHNGDRTYNLTDPKGLITDDEQEKINNGAHPLVYGDTLVEFLELVKKYVISHVHPYHGLPADPSTTTTDVIRFDLNRILNKNINSN
jgi:hypothetical protein